MPHVLHTQCKEYKLRVYLGHNENVTPLLTDFIINYGSYAISAPPLPLSLVLTIDD